MHLFGVLSFVIGVFDENPITRGEEIGVGRDYNITLNFRCKLLIRSSYSYSALFAYPFGHHSRNKYLIPLAEGLFESPTGVLRRELQSVCGRRKSPTRLIY